MIGRERAHPEVLISADGSQEPSADVVAPTAELEPKGESAAEFALVSERFRQAEELFSEFMTKSLRPSLVTRADSTKAVIQSIRNESLMLILLASSAGCALTILMARAVHLQQRTAASAQERSAFDARVSEALGMVHSEPDALRLVEDIIERVAPDVPTAILIADSSRAHLHQAAGTLTASHSVPLCGVRAPGMCPAVRRGVEITFASSEDFGACPHMRHRAGGPCSATCVPMTITGQHVGVLHAVTPEGKPLDSESILRLSVIAAKTGERIGVIRAFNRSEDQASKDALTGLLNRRSAEDRVQHLQRMHASFCIVYADIDHFKKLNDTHGHETGDRVLRQFSRIMRDALRPTDVVSRWGGEEFVMLLPDATLEQAGPVIERLRQAIAEGSGSGSVPAVTASFGLAECAPSDDFAERLNEADTALLRAKQEGRNRLAFAGRVLTSAG
jgi:diguanylate cyclase (GGDEF)-like protein